MNPRITSIENLIATDPGGRNVFALALPDQLRLAAQSLRLARRVGIVSGFFINRAGAGETDGPPGAKVLGQVLRDLGIDVDYITDERNAPLFHALGLDPMTQTDAYLEQARPTHLVSIERVGRGHDGRYRDMRGEDISNTATPLDQCFIDATQRGLTTIGIGDGGNEIGMGKVFANAEAAHLDSSESAGQLEMTAHCVVPTDFCIVAGVSNWGAFGLAGALCVLENRDLLPTTASIVQDFDRLVEQGGAVDGVTLRHERTCDGQDMGAVVRMLEQIRRHIAPSPIESGRVLRVGILGYGETGRATARLLRHRGHHVRISDLAPVTLEPGMIADGVESGEHTIGFLSECDLIVASPGVRTDSPILDELHTNGIYVMSELELAYQLHEGSTSAAAATSLIGVTGTIGKRSTVELLQKLFEASGRSLSIGGNRGRPLSDIYLDRSDSTPIGVAVSSFQLESVVHFRPHIAILLNIDKAHLDRHRTVAEYVRVKSRIFMNQKPDDVLILPFDDPRLRRLARKHQGRTFFVSSRQPVDRGAWIVDGRLSVNVAGCVEDMGQVDPPFAENLLAGVLAARLCGIGFESLARSLPLVSYVRS